jgi:hypothetical protein
LEVAIAFHAQIEQKKAYMMGTSKVSKEASIKIIESDIPRTFSNDHLFNQKGAFT